MSRYPSSPTVPPSQPGPIPPPASGSNGLGIAGFVVSLVGLLLTCTGWGWPLSIVGTVLSAVAMKKRPRGLAIAGLVLGLIGCVWVVVALVLLGGVMALGLFGGLAVVSAAQQQIEQANAAMVVSAAVQYQSDKGMPPADIGVLIQGKYLASSPLDAHGNVLYLKVGPDGKFEVWSAGPDEVNGTGDDREVKPAGG